MAEETKIESIASEPKSRRSAIKTAAQVAVTAPAVGLLLSAGIKTAQAYTGVCTADQVPAVDGAAGGPQCTVANDLTVSQGAFISDDSTFIGDDLYGYY